MSNIVTNSVKHWQGTPTQKIVLMCLADGAADDGSVPAWRSSIVAVCEWTCLKRTAVMESLKALQAAGLVGIDRSIGRVSTIKVMFSVVAELPNQSATRTSPADGPVRETDHHPSGKRTTPVRQTDGTRPPNGPLTPLHQTPEIHQGGESTPKDSACPPPPVEKLNVEKPKSEMQPTKKRSQVPPTSIPCPSDVDQQTWGDWLVHRKKKSAAVTHTVVTGARREAEKAGMTLDAFLQVWCLRGSQGLMAEWLKPNERQTQSRTSTVRHTGYAEADYTAGVPEHGRS